MMSKKGLNNEGYAMKNIINKLTILICLSLFFIAVPIESKKSQQKVSQKISLANQSEPRNFMKNSVIDSFKKQYVHKHILANGMTILVYPTHTLPKVSLQIWYNVGSKDEKTGEKGIAHLIEHMIFKGTELLSESDINEIVHALSGKCNAFTSNDYTGYLFNFSKHVWEKILPIIADCMSNARFADDHLNSEMKAVIQELKMRKDNYPISLAQELLSALFTDHPYHYPIIGYKQDLWNVNSADLRAFYKKHYLPNNATLVVTGDVNPEHVFSLAEKYFSNIRPNLEYTKDVFYYTKDISSKSVTLFREVNQPLIARTFVVPGSTAGTDSTLDILSWVLGSGKASRLYRKIVDERHLATSLYAFAWKLFDYSLLCIFYEPSNKEDVAKIDAIIADEIEDIIKNGLSESELTRAIKQTQMSHYNLLEDTEKQAFQIGKYFLAVGDENYIFKFLEHSPDYYNQAIKKLLKEYFRPTVMHKGAVLPLPEKEKPVWQALQERSDKQDEEILSQRTRESGVEPGRHVHTISANKSSEFDFPKPEIAELKNGIKLFYHNRPHNPKIALILDLKAKYYYDPQDKQGIGNFVSEMLNEGTKQYSAAQLADELESRGMSLSVSPGAIVLLMHHDDFQKGLEILKEILTSATFDEKEVKKVKAQILSEIKSFWDDANQISSQLLKEHIYKNHPYSKNLLGTKESIEAITQKDLIDYYKKYISPDGARLAIVGDLDGYNVPKLVEQVLGQWHGEKVKDIVFPSLEKAPVCEKNYSIARDQTVLCFAQLSIDRKSSDYDALLIFDQILGGGVLGSMASRLFQLREQSGLFYSISGSSLANISEQPGIFLVKTLVSNDRLPEAEKAIKNTLKSIVETITPIEIQRAKDAIVNSLLDHFESDKKIAQTFLFLAKYNLPNDYFDKRIKMLEPITLEQVKQAAKKILNVETLCTLKVGRVK